MSRDGYRGPKLPKVLLDKVQSGSVSKQHRDVSRKDKRKAERQTRKQPHRATNLRDAAERRGRGILHGTGPSEHLRNAPAVSAWKQPTKHARPAKSILKNRDATHEPQSDAETDLEEHCDDDGQEQSSDSEVDVSAPVVSRSTKRKLDEDDEEIAALEKKLGITGKKSKALQEDGLDWIAGGEDEESEDGEVQRPEDVHWLKSKRQKASSHSTEAPGEESDAEYENARSSLSSADDAVEDDFEGFTSEHEPMLDQKKQKENPYVAPVAASSLPAAPTKYIPPSLRKAATSDEEILRQLNRQVQGLLNRLSEANMISILQSLEEVYKNNARQHVTSTLIEILVGLLSDETTLNDTFLILHAAFSAAVYKVVGTDFGAQLLEKVVGNHDYFQSRKQSDGKQRLNLLAFVSNLYNFQLVGSAIPFDYIRLLLTELTEDNTELLLRIIRTSGQQLRQDDPSALKDIVVLLQKLVVQTGEERLSVRTKFMIETINNLKNNRMKTGLAASTLAAEHTTRMKRTLGTLNARAKATEPLRITLADIRDTEKKGKWWLVGASYHDPAKLSTSLTSHKHDDSDTGYESATPGSVNLTKLAKRQGMNTDVRRAIFISLLSASDHQDAHVRLSKLRLKNKQRLEIPRVMVSCVGGEEAYNPYYALVAKRVCSDHALRKAFQFTLWNLFRDLGNEGEDEDDDDDDAEGVSIRRVVNVAKFYAALVADAALSLAVLKKLDFASLRAKEAMFVEVFVTSALFHCRRASRGEEDAGAAFEAAVRRVFSVAGAGEMVVGLRVFLETTVVGSALARTKRERRTLEAGCAGAVEALGSEAPSSSSLVDDSEDGGE